MSGLMRPLSTVKVVFEQGCVWIGCLATVRYVDARVLRATVVMYTRPRFVLAPHETHAIPSPSHSPRGMGVALKCERQAEPSPKGCQHAI